MRKIRNFDRLTDHGDAESRRLVLTIAERTLDRLDAYNRIKSIMSFNGHALTVGTRHWDLDAKRNVYLVGAGKACNAMARAVDEVLGDRLTRGIAIVKVSEETDVFNRTEVYVGGHPLPDEEGHRASLAILDLVDQAGPDDLFIGVVSGGSSALMSCPIEGISLQDEMDATDVLLKSGAGHLRGERRPPAYLSDERRDACKADCRSRRGAHRLRDLRCRRLATHWGHRHSLRAVQVDPVRARPDHP